MRKKNYPEKHIPAGTPRAVMQKNEDDADTPLLPGFKPVLELLRSAPERIDVIFLRKGRQDADRERIADLCRAAGVRFSLLEPSLFARIHKGSNQGIVARLFEAGYTDIEELLEQAAAAPLPLVLALDQVQDPGNAGTLARTLYALGGAGLIVPRHNSAYLGAAAAKASAGALLKLPVAKVANLGRTLDAAKERGFVIYGASSGSGGDEDASSGSTLGKKGAERPLLAPLDIFRAQPDFPAVLVLGGEENGLRQGTEKRCDFLVRIPMLRDFDSLNVAQAGAIIMGWFAGHAGKKDEG